jgi:hypothetical protein
MAIAGGDEEAAVDPQELLRQEVMRDDPEIQRLYQRYEEARARIAANPGVGETAEAELSDFMAAVDAAVSKKLLEKLA